MRRRWLLSVFVLFAAAATAGACTIPVFRYALERWDLSAYEMIVFHSGPLSAEEKSVLKAIETGPPVANVRVETFDVSGKMPKARQAYWERFGKGQTLPWVALRAGDSEAKAPPAWNGPLEANALRSTVESPIRHKIIDRLSRGDTAVFLILESGDKTADDAARALVEKELTRLEKAIELPEQSEEGPQLRTGLPLDVKFRVLGLRRDDPLETAFVKILLASEEDLDQVKGPIVLPIFGRGRLLCSIYEQDIHPKQLANVARFLCGECSCQVKELNPGVDLLMPANWPELLERAGPPANPRPDTPSPKKRVK